MPKLLQNLNAAEKCCKLLAKKKLFFMLSPTSARNFVCWKTFIWRENVKLETPNKKVMETIASSLWFVISKGE